MQTFIIYDNTGKIIMTQAGDVPIPESVAMTVADVPEGKMVDAVNISTGALVLVDIPKTPEQLRLEALEARQDELSVDTDYRLLMLENGLN